MCYLFKNKSNNAFGCIDGFICDEGIRYHLEISNEPDLTNKELFKIFMVTNLFGGTIVIPHTRKGLEYREDLLTLE